ncbi:MAG: aromatic-ring-hydroxylating dioxygenase subunit beta [Gammaproteobacteria bacterium]|nr:MAG: aromatic-ring-hydroxylating dioxygenase subunit beta [Gammaproteobacteria bacterium]RLA14684.1 MAG: aromatic-ring-hydroxylating dioxygenase subunit beta [Gammaproteobacteria bacterium]
MSNKIEMLAAASELLYKEAFYVDGQKWDEWLDLFTEDCEYWMPSWKDEHEVTEDPKREISLIYYSGRFGLEDRVWRIRSGQSIASTPLPRTSHAVNNIMVDDLTDDGMTVRSTWQANCFFHKKNKSDLFYGDYEHKLRKTDDGWKICRKYVVLKNDYIPTMLDIYNA